jgi:KfrB protein
MDDMKIRLIVMNGQRIIQHEEEGKWQNHKVEKAGAIKPGIYNVYLATPAEKHKTYEGVIVHAEDGAVYQQVGRGFVMHARNDLDAVPVIGGTYRIEQGANKATVAAVSGRRRLARRI